VNWSGMAMNVQTCAMTGRLWGQACRNGSDKVRLSKCMTMLQQRLEMTKITTHLSQSCIPPEPYRHSGVGITPPFKGAPHLGRISKEARRKGKRLLMSPLSVKQKARALDTVIGSCTTGADAPSRGRALASAGVAGNHRGSLVQ